jgi:hypothetical protein
MSMEENVGLNIYLKYCRSHSKQRYKGNGFATADPFVMNVFDLALCYYMEMCLYIESTRAEQSITTVISYLFVKASRP